MGLSLVYSAAAKFHALPVQRHDVEGLEYLANVEVNAKSRGRKPASMRSSALFPAGGEIDRVKPTKLAKLVFWRPSTEEEPLDRLSQEVQWWLERFQPRVNIFESSDVATVTAVCLYVLKIIIQNGEQNYGMITTTPLGGFEPPPSHNGAKNDCTIAIDLQLKD
ncbi:hypothetical protein B0H19DRAFT_1070123 [Mycena capillaripes]|nr:hypothetical protein B0H19DRAFT_1070123 [Mycena capillaripes]